MTEWSECSKECDGGVEPFSRRTRTVFTEPCEIRKTLTVEEKCNDFECPQDCIVSDWDNCSQLCGEGTQTRHIVSESRGTGSSCPAQLTQHCNLKSCDADCAMSEWSKCDKACGVGGGVRTRNILHAPVGNGDQCGTTSEVCNDFPCPEKYDFSWYEYCDDSGCCSADHSGQMCKAANPTANPCPDIRKRCHDVSAVPDPVKLEESSDATGTYCETGTYVETGTYGET